MAIIDFNSVSGVSTVTATSSIRVGSGVTITSTSIVGVSTAGITTAYIGSINDGPISGFKNLIINGDMRLDQRNAGGSTTYGNTTTIGNYYGYSLDRWSSQSFSSNSSTGFAFSVVRSATAPVGFTSSVLLTTTTNKSSLETNDASAIVQPIEGFNVANLSWGTLSAKPVTLSFWVRSSLTGNFGGSIKNGTPNRSYPITYTINSANTWEYKTITIPGDTTGTWATDNTLGISVMFSLGCGSNYSGTVNTWQAGNIYQPTGSVSLVSTASATLYITGVQLESGTVATPFERRSYGQELALCQRYFVKLNEPRARGVANTTTSLNRMGGSLPVPMRIAPNISLSGSFNWYDGFGTGLFTTAVQSWATPESYEFDATVTSGTSSQGRPIILYYNTGSNYSITASAEL